MIKPDQEEITVNSAAGTPTGKLVIIHATRSGVEKLFPKEMQATINWFKKTVTEDPKAGASAHWVVSREGRTVRMVADTRRSQHAQEHNTIAWGIELEQAMDGDGFTGPQIAALASICKGYVADFGVAPVHTLDVTQSGFIGHEETPQGIRVGKDDPGSQFDWANFIQLLKEEDTPMTTQSTVATWWNNRTLDPTPTPANFTMQARADFALPATARRVRFGVYVAGGAGYLRFFNADGSEAEPAGWGVAKPAYATVEVTMAADGSVQFRVERGSVTIETVRSLSFSNA